MAPDDICHGPRCGLGVPLLPLAWWVGRVAPVCPTHGVLVLSCPSAALCVCSVLSHLSLVHRCARSGALRLVCCVLGHLAPVHRCARSVRCFASAVSWVAWLLFTVVPAWFVVLRLRCPGLLGSCSPVGQLGVLCCVWGVLGHLAPGYRCARFVCCVACALSWATWLLFSGVPARCVALRVRCAGPLGFCSPVCPLSVLCCVCGVLGHSAPVWFVVLHLRSPGPLRSCSPLCLLGVLCCVCRVLGHLAPVHRCARSVCCVACVVSRATWLLVTGVPASSYFSFLLGCPGPLGSSSAVCSLCFGLHRCSGGMACGAEVTAMSHGIFLLS